MSVKSLAANKMLKNSRQKDATSRARGQKKSKAFNNNSGARNKIDSLNEIAKKMQLPSNLVRKWFDHYEKSGVIGYVGQRQSAILCIYKRNPNITLTQLRILLKKVGIILGTSELESILKNLKPVLTDPMFTSATEDQLLQRLKNLTKVQPKTIIRMNQKNRKEQTKEYQEHSYALPMKSIFEDHNYVANPELYYEEDDYSIYDSVDKLAKYKTDLMNKIVSVSKSLDKLFSESTVKKIDNGEKDKKKFKLSILREQLIYLCLEMKGPKLSLAEVIQNLPISEVVATKWLEQAKNIKRFVHKKHVNKCCGKIQETIVRILKLNPNLTIKQVRDVLRTVNIDLSILKLERQLDSIKYMINGPEDFTEKDFDEMLMSDKDIDYCTKMLSLKITSINLSNEKCKKYQNVINDFSNMPLTLQKIIELYSTGKHCEAPSKSEELDSKSVPCEKNINENVDKFSTFENQALVNKLDMVRSKFQEELNKIIDMNINKKNELNILKTSNSKKYENNTIENTHSHKANGSTTSTIVDLLPDHEITEKVHNKQFNNVEIQSKPIKDYIKKSIKLFDHQNDMIDQSKMKSEINFLKYFSLIPKNNITGEIQLLNNGENQLVNQLKIKESDIYSKKHKLSCEDMAGTKKYKNVDEKKVSDVTTQVFRNNSEKLNSVKNDFVFKQQNNQETVKVNKNGAIKLEDKSDVEKEIIEWVMNKSILNNKESVIENSTFYAEKKIGINNEITTLKNKINDRLPNNQSIPSYVLSNYKEKKRKHSEDNIESEFEPIDDLYFTDPSSDSGILMEETVTEKEIMTEYIECEDNSVVIKYWLVK